MPLRTPRQARISSRRRAYYALGRTLRQAPRRPAIVGDGRSQLL